MVLGLQRNWVEPPYETEWDFFIKSLQHGKTDALIEVFLLIIIITLDLAVIFFIEIKRNRIFSPISFLNVIKIFPIALTCTMLPVNIIR